ncbi:hypothetical protein CLIB1444_03S02674 [[Candida] jaroonii]|uniref:Uncharacterized protein n=1 Tax=[Candida] jaroonii TaxID=467808 RepID=A0ACA9Y561_9ASCO|nr:hypothetical protein CLIB1444_03S02674 [[Candida] jaroonii]
MLVLTRDLKYVETDDLLKEEVEVQAPIAFKDNDLKPILENFQYEGDSISDEVKKLDFKIGAGVYFDIDKNPHEDEEEDCEPEPKKKKFWFLPFSVDGSNLREGEVTTMTVDSNLVVSTVDEQGGLFHYKPVDSKGLSGAISDSQDEEETEDKQEKTYSNKTNATVFSQFDQDCDSRGSRLGLFSCLLIGCLMAHYL